MNGIGLHAGGSMALEVSGFVVGILAITAINLSGWYAGRKERTIGSWWNEHKWIVARAKVLDFVGFGAWQVGLLWWAVSLVWTPPEAMAEAIQGAADHPFWTAFAAGAVVDFLGEKMWHVVQTRRDDIRERKNGGQEPPIV